MVSDETILFMYSRLRTCQKVADECGISNETVRRCLIRNGVPRKRHKQETAYKKNCKCSPKRRACAALVLMIFNEYGGSMRDIAVLCGLSAFSVSRALERSGIRKIKSKEPIFDSGIIGLYEDGCRNASEMARLLGASQSHISHRCKVLGLDMPTLYDWNTGVHEKAVASHGSEEALRKAKNAKPWKHSVDRWRSKCEASGAEFDKSVNLTKLIMRDGLTCKRCGITCNPNDKTWGSSGSTHPSIDHYIPLSKGGSHTWGNVRILCCKCNIQKSDKLESVA